MSTYHNRIKVADLETDQPNKILTTNSAGELEFSDRNNNYNALDYTIEGKALDARQGKVLKDLVDNINTLLVSDNVNLNTIQKLVDAVEIVQASSNITLVNDLTTGGTSKALTAEMGKLLQNTKGDRLITTNPQTGINYTLQEGDLLKRVIFSNSNPITLTVPTNTVIPLAIGSKIEYTQQGTGVVTVGGAGITFVTNLQLAMVKGETRILTKIDTDTWTIQGNQLQKRLIKGVIFVSSSGNNSTAEFENLDKPYLTLDAAITAFFSNPDATYIQILSATTFTISVSTNNGTIREFDLRSDVACIVNVITTSPYNFNGQSYKVTLPKGTINFNPTSISANGFGSAYININANVIDFSATYQAPASGNYDSFLTSKTLNVRVTDSNGIFNASGKATIKTETLNFRGISYLVGYFVYLTLDFDILTHDNIFTINKPNGTGTTTTIYHGNISSIAPYVNTTNFNYVFGTNLTINYKGITNISSNVSIARFNTNGSCAITGIVNLPNSNAFINSGNNYLGLSFINANITVKNVMSANNMNKLVTVTNSTFNLLGGYFAAYIETGGNVTYDAVTVEFIGTNYILAQTDGANITFDEPYWVSTNNPTWSIKNGALFTNGVITSGVNIVRRVLNQYNSSNIMP